ncbi:HpcH/HpaI aldolase/citrate lyase family protein [Pseudorhodoferax sp.]|uniref:HpcH/HpaI aldolase/citrate lyase family protein n=1 Tax=Pseudorhodoferax sp. TaxID=1993553 RepID=UPI002DD6939A|nr:CoA ester lyase [Pseudorhodoferax sp.]
MTHALPMPRRSVLYVPATNQRAIAKCASLPCDAVVFDLEDAVAPAMKQAAREQLAQAFAPGRPGPQCCVIRSNGLADADFAQDLALVARVRPDALLVPKLASVQDAEALCAAVAPLDARVRLWVMVETAGALSVLDGIVACLQAGTRLDCLVVGTNDIAKETGVSTAGGRAYLVPWLMRCVLAARRFGVGVLDGVWNDFADQAGFAAELAQSVRMGFDGKTLIHPSQVDAANRAFAPAEAALRDARAVVEAFAQPAHAAAGVIQIDGRMVERLHLAQAERLLALQAAIAARAT